MSLGLPRGLGWGGIGGGEGTQLQVTSSIFKSTAPARNMLRKIQNVGRCYSEGPGIQEFISS